ncbi:MAG TPA: pseudouridine synthase, partial [Candidatus Methylacidiphilales bacterium]|nr:pseudouridine synthase [Candidatus Methylacidiphilales bacterium]
MPRLNQFLASAGLGSRRTCDAIISDGRVLLNGVRVTQLATRVNTHDSVMVDGKLVKPEVTLTAVLNKPPGYLCSTVGEDGAKTIYDLLPKDWPRVFYVGRLDLESEGLLLLTNDGKLSQRIAHPSFKIRKTYEVQTDREFDFKNAALAQQGIILDGQKARFDEIHRLGPKALKIVLTQGIKRQIRRMLYIFGCEVVRLRRIQLGDFRMPNALKHGHYRIFTPEEVQKYIFGAAVPGKPKTAPAAAGAASSSPGAAKPKLKDKAKAKPVILHADEVAEFADSDIEEIGPKGETSPDSAAASFVEKKPADEIAVAAPEGVDHDADDADGEEEFNAADYVEVENPAYAETGEGEDNSDEHKGDTSELEESEGEDDADGEFEDEESEEDESESDSDDEAQVSDSSAPAAKKATVKPKQNAPLIIERPARYRNQLPQDASPVYPEREPRRRFADDTRDTGDKRSVGSTQYGGGRTFDRPRRFADQRDAAPRYGSGNTGGGSSAGRTDYRKREFSRGGDDRSQGGGFSGGGNQGFARKRPFEGGNAGAGSYGGGDKPRFEPRRNFEGGAGGGAARPPRTGSYGGGGNSGSYSRGGSYGSNSGSGSSSSSGSYGDRRKFSSSDNAGRSGAGSGSYTPRPKWSGGASASGGGSSSSYSSGGGGGGYASRPRWSGGASASG